METTRITIGFPDLGHAAANEQAESLLSEFKQDAELRRHLDLDGTVVARTDDETQDFAAILIAVLGTPAVVILAHTLKSWLERTGTSTIELDGVRIDNVRSKDIAAILKAQAQTKAQGQTGTQADPHRTGHAAR
jgi:homoaconitase/3-isopropylmalate dehydratase large subunit